MFSRVVTIAIALIVTSCDRWAMRAAESKLNDHITDVENVVLLKNGSIDPTTDETVREELLIKPLADLLNTQLLKDKDLDARTARHFKFEAQLWVDKRTRFSTLARTICTVSQAQ